MAPASFFTRASSRFSLPAAGAARGGAGRAAARARGEVDILGTPLVACPRFLAPVKFGDHVEHTCETSRAGFFLAARSRRRRGACGFAS
jgi:hypothetical protein